MNKVIAENSILTEYCKSYDKDLSTNTGLKLINLLQAYVTTLWY